MNQRALGCSGLVVGAVGFGTMALSLDDRPSEDDAVRTLHAAFDAGVTLVDTADVHGLDHRDLGHGERLLARALREKRDARVVVATKGGLQRRDGSWSHDARPRHLRDACERSLGALGIERIDLYQLHSPDPVVPLEDSVGELARLREEGKIAHVGLSNVNARGIEIARRIVPIVSVQNRWSPSHRAPETHGVLAHCTRLGVAFIPYSPFGGERGARALGVRERLSREAARRGISPHRLTLAWMLAKSPVVIPIPGARRAESAVDSALAADVVLSAEDVRDVEAALSDQSPARLGPPSSA